VVEARAVRRGLAPSVRTESSNGASSRVPTFLTLFHQVTHLQDLDFPAGKVGAAIGVINAISLPGRFSLSDVG
jgi:hypothetical protein